MKQSNIHIGLRVRTNCAFSGVPEGTEGVIIEDYGTGITVGWDKQDRPYPHGLSPREVAAMPAVDPQCPLRDGFDKDTELKYLEPA